MTLKPIFLFLPLGAVSVCAAQISPSQTLVPLIAGAAGGQVIPDSPYNGYVTYSIGSSVSAPLSTANSPSGTVAWFVSLVVSHWNPPIPHNPQFSGDEKIVLRGSGSVSTTSAGSGSSSASATVDALTVSTQSTDGTPGNNSQQANSPQYDAPASEMTVIESDPSTNTWTATYTFHVSALSATASATAVANTTPVSSAGANASGSQAVYSVTGIGYKVQ